MANTGPMFEESCQIKKKKGRPDMPTAAGAHRTGKI